jgi:hypothetical protein
MTEKPKCFGYFGTPSSVLLHNNVCTNCNITAKCEQKLKEHIESHVKKVKETKQRGTVDFDIFNVGYIMKPSTADKVITLYQQYADKKSHYCMGRETNGTFYDLPKENIDKFIIGLKEILTNLDNLATLKVEWQNANRQPH